MNLRKSKEKDQLQEMNFLLNKRHLLKRRSRKVLGWFFWLGVVFIGFGLGFLFTSLLLGLYSFLI